MVRTNLACDKGSIHISCDYYSFHIYCLPGAKHIVPGDTKVMITNKLHRLYSQSLHSLLETAKTQAFANQSSKFYDKAIP